MSIFKYNTECHQIGFQNVSKDNEPEYNGFERALAYLDGATGGDLTVSEEVFCVRCNSGRDVSALIEAVKLSDREIETQDIWDGWRYYLVSMYECPECKNKGENTRYLRTKEAKSDMQIYGYKGANYGT